MKKFVIFLMTLGCFGADDRNQTLTHIANPSATHCIEKGYTYEMKKNKDGSAYGMCVFKDGECEAWSYFRGECNETTGSKVLNDGEKAYYKNDFRKALPLLTKACDEGNPFGCFDLAQMYNNANGVKKDQLKAVKLFEKACDGGDVSGCTNAGWSYYRGVGVKKDLLKGVDFIIKGCQGVEGECLSFNIGMTYKAKDVTKSNHKEALAVFRHACDRGIAFGCLSLAQVYEKGKGVAKDHQQAKVFYSKACLLKEKEGFKGLERLGE